jgi:cytochrome c oxidase assembly protein subunit 15
VYTWGVDSSALGRQAAERRFARFALLVLVYLSFVIVFGAWVRITGSGAGCGAHWPSCRGELVPRTPSHATLIEYTHRLTSGLLGVLSLALPLWAWRVLPAGHSARRSSFAVLGFVVVEAAIGAALVKNGLVAEDASLARAVVVALHLVNTLLLTGSAALTALWAQPRAALAPAAPGADRSEATARAPRWAVWGCLVGLTVVAASGAVTALGDTLFPVSAHSGPVSAAHAGHFLVQLRVLHPVLACLLACGVVGLAGSLARDRRLAPYAWATVGFAALQVVIGSLNVLFYAPGWLQITHLFVAQLFWIALVALGERVLAVTRARGLGVEPRDPSAALDGLGLRIRGSSWDR